MSREHIPEVNQTLWIKGEKIIEIWPNLPDQPDSLLGASLSSIPALQSFTHSSLDKKEEGIARMRHKYIRSKAHEAQITQWHLALRLSWLLITLVLILAVVKYGYVLLTPFLTARHFLNP
jgi:hypothetical protein